MPRMETQTETQIEATPAASGVTDVVAADHAQNLRLVEALVFAGAQAID